MATCNTLVFCECSVVLGQNGWSVTYTTQSICVLKGSTVELSCAIRYPSGTVTSTFWFTKMETGVEPEDLSQNPEYAGRLEYHGDKKNGHNLRIADLREKDSATYKFRFITDQTGGKYTGDPGVTLSVTDVVLEMDPTSVSERENVTLTCRTKCTLDPITAYSWYKNGQPIPNSNTYSPVYILFSVSSEDTGRYSCAVKDHEDLPSAEETLTVTFVLGQNGWSVTYTTQSICVLKGSTVKLSCSIRYPSGTVTSTFWFTKMETGVEPEDLSQNPEYAGRLEYHGDKKNGHNLRIADLREKDSATQQ
ncbi:uncharacterized protein LOC115147891 [Salmo trutta]|uniref:uncharacterized protein LOC115147891 n=1 Tax=Salmo trutta TaxID=8032 RepID=UPI0011322A02|nr:uncharacterized protein LOC115147891 [Salmo trutta]